MAHGPASVLGDEKFTAMGSALGPKSGPASFLLVPNWLSGYARLRQIDHEKKMVSGSVWWWRMLTGDASYRSHQTFLQCGSDWGFGFWIPFCISYLHMHLHCALARFPPIPLFVLSRCHPIPQCPLLSGPSRRRPPGKRLTSSRPRKLATAASRWDANQAMCTGSLP